MNEDYVSRQLLLDEYDRLHKGPPGKARTIIETAPSSDVEPVRHGRWIIYSARDCLYTCSECRSVPRDRYPYCPICGAKMDLGVK